MSTILVLDDGSVILNLLCYVLQCHGYRTLGAGTAEEAVRRFRESSCRIDVLIADVSLPQGSGVEVALTLRQYCPDLPVILASGYPGADWTAQDCVLLQRLGRDSVRILHKPFGPHALLKTIRDLTAADPSEAGETA